MSETSEPIPVGQSVEQYMNEVVRPAMSAPDGGPLHVCKDCGAGFTLMADFLAHKCPASGAGSIAIDDTEDGNVEHVRLPNGDQVTRYKDAQ